MLTPPADNPAPGPAAADARPSAAAPTDRVLWWELAAVLAVGVVPHQLAAVTLVVTGPQRHPPFWLDAVNLTVQSAFTVTAVLFVMYRNGERWAAFGVVRPRLIDPTFGCMLFILARAIFLAVGPSLPVHDADPGKWYPVPAGPLDHLASVVMCVVNGFAEELVARAYLVTRLVRLLRSKPQAVVVSAAAFASYHLHYGPGGVLLAVFVMGFAYGGLYLAFRRLWPFALGHAAIDVYFELAA